MKKRRCLLGFIFIALTFLQLPRIVAGPTDRPPLELLVFSGDPSPIEGATSMGLLSWPICNENGSFLFNSANPTGANRYKQALFVSTGRALNKVIEERKEYWKPPTLAPFGFPQSIYFEGQAGGILNDANAVFFYATLGSGYALNWPEGIPLGPALWLSSGGEPSLITGKKGTPSNRDDLRAPGIPQSALHTIPYFTAFSSLKMNNNGFYVFMADVNTGSSTESRALYSGRNGSISLVNWSGADARRRIPYGFELARDADIGYFVADFPGSQPTLKPALYRFSGAISEKVIGVGEPLPGKPEGAEVLTLWDVDEAGNALIEGSIGTGQAPGYGLWEASASGLKQIVPFNKEIQTSAGMLMITSLGDLNVGVANVFLPRYTGGRAAFMGFFSGLGTSRGLGLFKVDANSDVQAVFLSLNPGPGSPYVFSAPVPFALGAPIYDRLLALNAHGRTAFFAAFTGDGVTENTMGLFVESSPGVLQLVLRVGEILNVRGTDRKVADIIFDSRTALSDSGTLHFRVRFTDLHTAIYRVKADAGQEFGTEFHWVGNLNDNWHTVLGGISNWKDEFGNKRSRPPGTGGNEKVFINNAPVRILDESVAIGSIKATGSLTVNKPLAVAGAVPSEIQSISLAADLTVIGSLTLTGESECVKSQDPNGTIGFQIEGGSVTNRGTLKVRADAVAVLRSGNDGKLPLLINAGIIENLGTIQLIDATIDNIAPGRIRNSGELSTRGTIKLSGAELLNDSGGRLTFEPRAEFIADGSSSSILRTRGELIVNTGRDLSPPLFELQGGTVEVRSGTLNIGSHKQLHTGTGQFLVRPNAVLRFVGQHEFAATSAEGYSGVIEGVVEALANAPMVKLRAIEVTQSIQDLDNSILLIAGKKTIVRCFVDPIGPGKVNLEHAKIEGYRGAEKYTDSPVSAENPLMHLAKADSIKERGLGHATLNFRLPLIWTSNQLSLHLTWTNGVLFREPANLSKSVIPIASVTVEFTEGAVPHVEFMQIRSWKHIIDAVEYSVSDFEMEELADSLRAMYPAAEIKLNQRATDSFGKAPRSPLMLDNVNAALARFKATEVEQQGIPNRIWHAVFASDILKYPTISWEAFNPQKPSPQGLYSQELGISSSIYGFSYTSHAHEIAHDLGLHHAVDTKLPPSKPNVTQGWCGEEADLTAPNFPYFYPIKGVTMATLGPMEPGNHFSRVFAHLEQHDQLFPDNIGDPSEMFELMSYCDPLGVRWASGFTYTNLFVALKARFPPPERPRFVALANSSEFEVLIISGSVNLADNSTQIDPLVRSYSKDAPLAPRPGNFELLLLSDTGAELLRLPFSPQIPVTEGRTVPTTASFLMRTLAVPAIKRVQVVLAGAILAERVASANSPSVRVLSPNGSETLGQETVTFAWEAHDPDNDTLLFLVQYSPNGGDTWRTLVADWPDKTYSVNTSELPASNTGLLRVTATDGFLNGSDESDQGFLVTDHPPRITFESNSPKPVTLPNSEVFFQVRVYDPDTGSVLQPDVEWTSDRDGILGRGAQIHRSAQRLSPGRHRVTATYTEPGGASWAESKDILVLRAMPELHIETVNGGYTISWPTNFDGFSLESSLDLGATASWILINRTEIGEEGNSRIYRIPAIDTNRFYRLIYLNR